MCTKFIQKKTRLANEKTDEMNEFDEHIRNKIIALSKSVKSSIVLLFFIEEAFLTISISKSLTVILRFAYNDRQIIFTLSCMLIGEVR